LIVSSYGKGQALWSFNHPPPLTIWVHGTLPGAFFPSKLLYKIGPIKRFFYCHEGLHKALDLAEDYHMRNIVQILHEQAPERFALETFYLFGWSGKLRTHERENAAQNLYKQLSHVIEKYHDEYNTAPYIQLISFSHGGNVVLLMAPLNDEHDCPFHIDELILLACPVQHETAHLITNQFFKRIYAIHSHHMDLLQVLDPQGVHLFKCLIWNLIKEHSWQGLKNAWQELKSITLFSERHFPSQENLTQICLKLNWRYPMHGEFLLSPFLRSLPAILTEAQQSDKTEQTSLTKSIRMKVIMKN